MLTDHERVRLTKLFTDAITTFCRVGFEGQIATKVDALMGITFDNNEVLLIKVDECLAVDENQQQERTLDTSNSDLLSIKVERVSESRAGLEGSFLSGTDASGSETRAGMGSSRKRKLLNTGLYAVEDNWQLNGDGDIIKADGTKCRNRVEIDLGSVDLDLDCTNDEQYLVGNQSVSRQLSKGSITARSGKMSKSASSRRSKAVLITVAKRVNQRDSLQKNDSETVASTESSQPNIRRKCKSSNNKNTSLTSEVASSFIEELPDMPDSVRCKLCGINGSRAYMLRDHINGVHLLHQRYSCQNCGQYFKWRSSLYRHRNLCMAENDAAAEHLGSGNDDGADVGDSERHDDGADVDDSERHGKSWSENTAEQHEGVKD